MVDYKDTGDAGAKNVARVLKRLNAQGVALNALRFLLSGKGVGHLVVTDGSGNVEVESLLADGQDALKGLSLARLKELERLGFNRSDDLPFADVAPFSEIFVELFNENPPFLEGPVARRPGSVWHDPSWWEGFDEGPFDELFLEGPWNEDPPFVEGPWNENPPFLEETTSLQGRAHRHFERVTWRINPPEGFDPRDRDQIDALRKRTSVVTAYDRIVASDKGSGA